MSYYRVEEIYPWLYSIYDPMDVYCYLAVGEEAAVLYDTGYGVGPLDAAVQKVCDKPYAVVISHGHIDHANGAYLFSEPLIHPGDDALYFEHTGIRYRKSIVKRLAEGDRPDGFDPQAFVDAKVDVTKALEAGRVFELGGMTAEVVPMEGHTAGSVGLYIKERKVLLCSDATNPHVWMFLDESLPITDYIKMLVRVKGLDFDTFFVGHSNVARPKSEIDEYIRVARNIDPDRSTPYTAIPELEGLLYQEGDVAIAYRPDKL